MAKFEEISKNEWEYMKAKYGYEVKSELSTNTYTDIYVKIHIDGHEVSGKIRKYMSVGADRYYIWR